MIYHGGSV
jgi:hypothetical protein